MTTTDPIERRANHSRGMLEDAAEMLAQGDRLQASKQIWSAAAERLKAIAMERGWPCESRADGTVIARHIARQTDNRRIALLFSVAVVTHQNFYEDHMSADELAERIEDIRTLLSLLDEAHGALPLELPMPDDRHYRQRHG